jgi:hypothetical protein
MYNDIIKPYKECNDCPVENIECDRCISDTISDKEYIKILSNQIAKLANYLMKNEFDIKNESAVDCAIRHLKLYSNRCK